MASSNLPGRELPAKASRTPEWSFPLAVLAGNNTVKAQLPNVELSRSLSQYNSTTFGSRERGPGMNPSWQLGTGINVRLLI